MDFGVKLIMGFYNGTLFFLTVKMYFAKSCAQA